jgi:hypothetical protein
MKPKTMIRSLVFAVALLVGSALLLPAAEPAKEVASLSEKLITAVAKSDFDIWAEDWGEPFKKTLKKEPFTKTCALYAVRFQAGYEISYLGNLQQQGAHVTLWKVSFKDHSDDALVTLVMKEGKVAGFWIK